MDGAAAAHLLRWQKLFDAAPFVAHLGVRVMQVTPGEAHTTLAVQPHHLQHSGQVHAGVMTTLADHCAGAAAQSSLPDPFGDSAYCVTVELKLSLLRPAKGTELRCQARVLKSGRQLVFTEADVWCRDGEREQQVARLSATIAVIQTVKTT